MIHSEVADGASDPELSFDRNVTIVRSLEDIRPAAEALRDIARAIGDFQVAPCANLASKDPMVDADGNVLASDVFGWPDSEEVWWKQPLVALNSPLPRACRYESEVFWSSATAIHARQPNRLLQEIDLTKFVDHVGAASVICVPVHLPFGQIGAVSFSPPDLDTDDLSDEYAQYGSALEEFSRRFIAGYVKATDRRGWIPADCKLTKREVECLRWAALGKTDQEIAMLLSRSCATVRRRRARS